MSSAGDDIVTLLSHYMSKEEVHMLMQKDVGTCAVLSGK